MNPRRTSRFAALALCAILALWSNGAFACAACFGKSDGKLAAGMAAGILSLLFVVVCVLGGIALFFVHIVRRERQAEQAVSQISQVEHELH